MKIIDNSFNEIEDKDLKYNSIYSRIIDYLKSIISDEKILSDMMSDNDNILIQEADDNNKYSIRLPNGKTKIFEIRGSVGALKANMDNKTSDKELTIIPGIALRQNFTSHQLVHELVHAISSNQHNYFDEEGNFYTKTGTKIDYYDKNCEDVKKEYNPSSDGLNEGITEFLTSLITNEFTGNYPAQVVIAKLLMASNNNLLNAYFSKDLNELEKFYQDLEEKQSIITRKDLIKFGSKESNIDLIIKIIVGSIKYNQAYNCELDINEILNYLNENYTLDSGSWNDLISNSIDNSYSV